MNIFIEEISTVKLEHSTRNQYIVIVVAAYTYLTKSTKHQYESVELITLVLT